MFVGELFDSARTRDPDKTFLKFEDEEVTYDDMENRVARTATVLTDSGITEGDRVGLVSANRPAVVELFLACAQTGAVFTPCNPELTASELTHLLGLSKPALVAASGEKIDTVIEAADRADIDRVIPIDNHDEVAVQSLRSKQSTTPTDAGVPDIESTAPLVHMYTSGTTGEPKACELSHRSWTHTRYFPTGVRPGAKPLF